MVGRRTPRHEIFDFEFLKVWVTLECAFSCYKFKSTLTATGHSTGQHWYSVTRWVYYYSLAIYNNDHMPSGIKMQKFSKYQIRLPKNSPKTFKLLLKWQYVGKSGHTGTTPWSSLEEADLFCFSIFHFVIFQQLSSTAPINK